MVLLFQGEPDGNGGTVMDEASTDGGGLLKPGEGTLYTARGSVMAWSRDTLPATGEERALMARFGMSPA
jgi:hypothetical protein